MLAAMVSPVVTTRPSPGMPMHAADVAVVQLVVAQLAFASTAVVVALSGAKFMPVNVTLAKPNATLYGDDADNAGAC